MFGNPKETAAKRNKRLLILAETHKRECAALNIPVVNGFGRRTPDYYLGCQCSYCTAARKTFLVERNGQ